jgi:hypothetical protein
VLINPEASPTAKTAIMWYHSMGKEKGKRRKETGKGKRRKVKG